MRQSTGCSPIAQQSAVAAAIRFGAYAFLRSLTSKSLREQILIVRRASIVHIILYSADQEPQKVRITLQKVLFSEKTGEKTLPTADCFNKISQKSVKCNRI